MYVERARLWNLDCFALPPCGGPRVGTVAPILSGSVCRVVKVLTWKVVCRVAATYEIF